MVALTNRKIPEPSVGLGALPDVNRWLESVQPYPIHDAAVGAGRQAIHQRTPHCGCEAESAPEMLTRFGYRRRSSEWHRWKADSGGYIRHWLLRVVGCHSQREPLQPRFGKR